MGLALVSRFAGLHGGRAWVEERRGGGASFRVFLPADPPSLEVLRDDGESELAESPAGDPPPDQPATAAPSSEDASQT